MVSFPSHTEIDVARLVALRRCVLAVSVIDGFDAMPGDDGVTLDAGPQLLLPWAEVDRVVGDTEPEGTQGRSRLRTWFQMRTSLLRLRDPQRHARAIGLPRGHVLHPGPPWVRHHVHGGGLDLGVGLIGLFDDPDQVVVVPRMLFAAAGIDDEPWWPLLAFSLEQTGRLAAARHTNDPQLPLRPFGDFDVVTLLGSSAFRTELCQADPLGWRSAAVPMRQRGWLDLGRIDPAFAAAAALATEPHERGFERAILVTSEEVVVIAAG
ncbi:MAG TPA: hypothetical protein VMT27_01525, partial [Actinomycetes bacterium]|nr:hypothetical protein [Actinomycetes bacterium]